ncbi:MAG: hypothetical protein K2X27_03070, partial [Candidatus Obscuribacterales bacterium]|nr:hypothetical protein [Candidatus Obscuribacterales bacterium]
MKHPKLQARPQTIDLGDLEFAVSSGGSAAVLAGVGAILAAETAGITSWRRLFGVSGGAVLTSLVSV